MPFSLDLSSACKYALHLKKPLYFRKSNIMKKNYTITTVIRMLNLRDGLQIMAIF